jgi:drug/metabolite transporter (DMT)-like permease
MYLKLVASMIIWGGTWVAGRVVSASMDPYPAAFLRFFFAALFMTFMTIRLEHRLPRLALRDCWNVALLAASGIVAYNVLFFEGLKTVPAGRAAVIVGCIPAVLALTSSILFKDRLPLSRVLGIPLSLAGVVMVISGGDYGSLLRGGVGLGELCIFGCVVAWTVYTLAGKKAMAGMSPLSVVTWSCIVGDAFLFAVAWPSGLFSQAAAAPPIVWISLLFLGVIATGLAFCWYYEGVKALGPSRAGIFINLVPVTAVLLGALLLDEPVTWTLLGGGALVIGGVWLVNRPSRPPGE